MLFRHDFLLSPLSSCHIKPYEMLIFMILAIAIIARQEFRALPEASISRRLRRRFFISRARH